MFQGPFIFEYPLVKIWCQTQILNKNDHTNPEAQTGGTIRHNIGFAYSVQKARRVTNGVEIPKECDDVPKKSEVKTP